MLMGGKFYQIHVVSIAFRFIFSALSAKLPSNVWRDVPASRGGAFRPVGVEGRTSSSAAGPFPHAPAALSLRSNRRLSWSLRTSWLSAVSYLGPERKLRHKLYTSAANTNSCHHLRSYLCFNPCTNSLSGTFTAPLPFFGVPDQFKVLWRLMSFGNGLLQ